MERLHFYCTSNCTRVGKIGDITFLSHVWKKGYKAKVKAWMRIKAKRECLALVVCINAKNSFIKHVGYAGGNK